MSHSPSSLLALSLPPHLDALQAKGASENEAIAQFEIGDMQNFIYLVMDWASKRAAIVDPQKDLRLPLAALEKFGFSLESIILTHTHFDHIAGVKPLLEKFPTLDVWVGERDLHRLPTSMHSLKALKVLKHEEHFSVGGLRLRAFSTPGHSGGAFSYFLETQAGLDRPYLFTGDTIFIRDCGRTDLDTGSNAEMFASIQAVKALPDTTVLLVGHHYAEECSTTIRAEKKASPPFQCSSVEELARLP